METLTTSHFTQRALFEWSLKKHWAAMFILASIMDTDLEMGSDQHGFVWLRTCICDLKRPNPAFSETTITDPESGELVRVKGDGNLDYRGAITSIPFGYVVCTMLEIHEAFDTRIVRKGKIPTDTFVCFTSRYPVIFFQKDQVPNSGEVRYVDCI